MNKREFLKTGGLLGVASLLPTGRLFASGAAGSCVLIPTETAGPFPLDLTANTFYFRQDVREDRTGAPLRLRLRILGDQNCGAMENLRVNIWHCDADGVYSGYTNQNGGVDTTGLTFLRGYQITDANGDVEFLTIFPGWYPGRVCHIHFQVYVNSNYSAISQLTFPITEKQAVYTDNPTLYPAGTDPLTPSQDGIFSDGYQYQEATLTFNSLTQEYESYLEVTVQGTGVPTGLQEVRNAEQFSVGQNQPNPFTDRTVIPIVLKQTGDLTLDLYDLNGRRVARIVREGLAAGEHVIAIAPDALGISPGSYAYQVEVRNANGVFRQVKLMTAAR
ncbi:MAG: T9SS type A sorting domain-containing protein [Flavobacteriales bacterium]|nr:T9SS type A sorting domain-containing protein [Flavobacteriales bacterium]MCB9168331.1 T9SS type A sorting domain-containing protein [Flavobacteriales bacterium]